MRAIKAILLLLLFSFVLGHSVFPHHHHLAQPMADHHHYHDVAHHHDAHEDSGHSIFSFIQIDDIFINGKQLTVPITIVFAPSASFTFVISEKDVKLEYVEKDIDRPPLI